MGCPPPRGRRGLSTRNICALLFSTRAGLLKHAGVAWRHAPLLLCLSPTSFSAPPLPPDSLSPVRLGSSEQCFLSEERRDGRGDRGGVLGCVGDGVTLPGSMWWAALGFYHLWALQDLVWAQQNRTAVAPQDCSLDCIRKVGRRRACAHARLRCSIGVSCLNVWERLELLCSLTSPSRTWALIWAPCVLGPWGEAPPSSSSVGWLVCTHVHTSSSHHHFGPE